MTTRKKLSFYVWGANINKLPYEVNLNKIDILKQLNISNNKIGELKGMINILSNYNLFKINYLSESKESHSFY